MALPLSPTLHACMASPIVESRAWVKGQSFAADRPLINVSQAAPVAAPPEGLRQAMAEAKVLKSPDAEMMGDGTGILVVDDLVDTGKTLELVRSLYPKAHFATVYAKPKGEPMVETFITGVSQDTWIFFPWDMALQYVEPYRK